jgi:WD40 repeat protein
VKDLFLWSEPMNNNIRVLFTIATVILILCLSGCSWWPGVKIIDLETMGSKLSYSQHSFVLSVNEQKREFVIMDYTANKVILTTMDYEGNKVGEQKIDMFNSLNYLQEVSAISPDKRYFVYLNRADRSLYLHDFETDEKTKLIEKQLVSAETFLRGVKWISDSEILIFKEKSIESLYSPIDDSSITRFNVKTKSIVKKIEVVCPEKFEVSPSGNYLAVLDGFSIHQDFKLFDLRTLELLEFRKNSGFEYISKVCWSPSEKYLAYVKNDSIVIRPRDSAKEREVKSLHKDVIIFYLAFLNENTLIYRYGLNTDSPERYILRAIDLTTGKESILLKNEILSGDIYVVDNGKKLIAEVGD